MTFLSRTLAVPLLGLALSASPAAAQPAAEPLKNPQVTIEYVATRTQQNQEVFERAKKYRVLELLQEFLAPLRLPKTLAVRMADCGGNLEVPYTSGQPVTICYEFMRQIDVNAPGSRVIRIGPRALSKDEIIIGAYINLILNQVAYAVIDILDLPVWGRPEDAADSVAALVMLEFKPDPNVVWATLAGTSWFLAQRGFWGTGTFADVVRGGEAQRFYNYACMAYGAYPKPFSFLVTNGDLPKDRADYCGAEYRGVRRSFMQTIMPHVDLVKLKQTRGLDWAARLQLPNR